MPKIDSTQLGRGEACAEEIRGLLGITSEIQRKWVDEKEALNEWRKAIEKLGILIFQISMPVEESRGFSLADGKVPAIILNPQDSVKGRIFSLLHELGHILLDKSGLCNMIMEFGSNGEKERIEYFSCVIG